MLAKRLFFAILVAAPAFSATLESIISDTKLTATTHSIFSNEQLEEGSDQKDFVFMHEGIIRADSGRLSANVQFTDRFAPQNERQQNVPFVLEKTTGSYEWANGKILVGDTHLEVGKGIALSLYRDTVFGIDNTLQGAYGEFRTSSLETKLYGGRINEWNSPVAIYAVPDLLQNQRRMLVGGATVKEKISKSSIEGHYVYAESDRFSGPPGPLDQRWHTVGAVYTQDDFLGGADLYMETNALMNQSLSQVSSSLGTGYGSYASLTWSDFPWVLKTELKDYRNYNFDFRRPPSLEEDFVLDPNITNATAVKFGTEYRFSNPKNALTASLLYGQDRDLGASQTHPIVGAKWQWFANSEWQAQTGYRYLPGKDTLSHVTLKSKVPTYKSQAFEMSYTKYYERKTVVNTTLQDHNLANIAYSFHGTFTLGLGYEYYPQDPNNIRNFFNLTASYTAQDLTARTFIGQTSGGVVCSGGVCREIPPYTGAYLDVSYSF